MAYVYILESTRDGRYYIGSCVDIIDRLHQHKSGWTPSTRRFGGFNLVLKQEYHKLSEARAVERKLKKLKRKDYLSKIVREGKIHWRP